MAEIRNVGNCEKLVQVMQRATARYNAQEREVEESRKSPSLEVIVPVLQVYQDFFLNEIDFALDKNLHQELWKSVVKVQVNKLCDKQNPDPANSQKIIRVIQGFYESTIAVLNQRLNPKNDKAISFVNQMHEPNYYKTRREVQGALFLLQDSYVHLGDIFRYLSNPGEQVLANGYLQNAQEYYKQASTILPSNGQPYNQLAILSFQQKDTFHLIYYWCKAVDAKSPFQASRTNLIRQLERLRGRPQITVKMSLQSTAPMKKIEIAKKYFLRTFGRVFLLNQPLEDSSLPEMGAENEFIISVDELLEVNKLFSFPVRSNNVGWLFVKSIYLYIWLFSHSTAHAKQMVLAGLLNFVELMMAREDRRVSHRAASPQAPNQQKPKKISNTSFENVLPAIRLSVNWLHYEGYAAEIEYLAGMFMDKFTKGLSPAWAADLDRLFESKQEFALSEDVEIKGMQTFMKETERLDFSETVTEPAANEKRRAIIAATLKKYYREPEIAVTPGVTPEKIAPPPGLSIIKEETGPPGSSPLQALASSLNKKSASPFGPPPGFERASFDTPPPPVGNPFLPQPVMPMPSYNYDGPSNAFKMDPVQPLQMSTPPAPAQNPIAHLFGGMDSGMSNPSNNPAPATIGPVMDNPFTMDNSIFNQRVKSIWDMD